MIAPIRQTDDRALELGGARRAVAEMLLHGKSERQERPASGASNRASWILVAWAAAVTLVYLFRGSR